MNNSANPKTKAAQTRDGANYASNLQPSRTIGWVILRPTRLEEPVLVNAIPFRPDGMALEIPYLCCSSTIRRWRW
jgi:hypothetical protein